MVGKLVPPKLDPIDDPAPLANTAIGKPDLRTTARRPRPVVDSLISQGFVTEAALPERIEPDVPMNAQHPPKNYTPRCTLARRGFVGQLSNLTGVLDDVSGRRAGVCTPGMSGLVQACGERSD